MSVDTRAPAPLANGFETIRRALFDYAALVGEGKPASEDLASLWEAVSVDALHHAIVEYVGRIEPHAESLGLAKHLHAVLVGDARVEAALAASGAATDEEDQ